MNDVTKNEPIKPVSIKVKLTFLSPYIRNITIKPLYFKKKKEKDYETD